MSKNVETESSSFYWPFKEISPVLNGKLAAWDYQLTCWQQWIFLNFLGFKSIWLSELYFNFDLSCCRDVGNADFLKFKHPRFFSPLIFLFVRKHLVPLFIMGNWQRWGVVTSLIIRNLFDQVGSMVYYLDNFLL